MTLWAGRVGDAARARGVGVPARRRTTSSCPTTSKGTADPRAAARGRRPALGRPSSPRSRSASRRSRSTTSRRPTRTSTRRSSGCSATLGRKIHAGRSRNDQVAAAFRLYVAHACAEGEEALAAFVARDPRRAAEAEAATPMPGYTHLQRAIPVTLGHHLLAWVEMLERDRDRLRFAGAQAAPSPLGAGALAGSTLPLPPPPEPDAQHDRRGRRPRLRARLPLRGRGALHAPLADRRGARALDELASSASPGCPRTPRPAPR